MRIRKGDTVKMLAGRDRGKTGKVIRSIPKRRAVVVEGMNLLVKHLRARKQGEQGQRVQFPAPVPVDRVMLICPKCNRATRVGARFLEDHTKQRECKKCRQTFS
ncbi:50S ribosomal protein L24 [Candidatus Uhrbacteria bacterium]|nr:50S ribosomal protein L24 [Candidatus Uhrbacteria bacterium]